MNSDNNQNTILSKLVPTYTGLDSHVMLDYGHNPRDLRPVLTAINQKVEEESRKLLNEQKLIVLYRENHESTTDHFLKVAMSKKLHTTFDNRFMLSVEAPYNSKKEEKESLTTGFNYTASSYFAQTVLDSNISISFTDIIGKEGIYGPVIDRSDPEIDAFILENFPQYSDRTLSVRCLDVRNAFMSHKLFEQAQNYQDIIFFPVGGDHVMGALTDDLETQEMQEELLADGLIDENELEDTRHNNPYSESLCATFLNKAFQHGTMAPRILVVSHLGNDKQSNEYVLEKAQEHTGPILFLKGGELMTSLTDLWTQSGKELGCGLPQPHVDNKSLIIR